MERHASLVLAIGGITPVGKTEVVADQPTQQPRSGPPAVEFFVLFPNKFSGLDGWTGLNPKRIHRVPSLKNHLSNVPADLGYGDS